MIAEGFSFKGFCVFLDFFDSLNAPHNQLAKDAEGSGAAFDSALLMRLLCLSL
jgi:hypothetical protein